MSKRNLFQTTANKLLQTDRFDGKKKNLAEAMGLPSASTFSRYYNGDHIPPLDKAVEMFEKVGCKIEITVE